MPLPAAIPDLLKAKNSTIAGGGTLMTITAKNQLLTSKFAETGDAILITKGCAISSVAILAKSFPETVKRKAGMEHYHHACESFYDISVLKDALTIMEGKTENGVTAMHDVTEGGVLSAIYEMAIASGNGAKIYFDKLPISETQLRVCEVFSLDPSYCIGAGALVITCKKKAVPQIIKRLGQKKYPLCRSGGNNKNSNGIKLIKENRESDLIYGEKDPYWEAFFTASRSGWK